MRALVLGGAGAVCQETTRDLSRFSDFEEIVVADYNVAAAQAIVDSLRDKHKDLMYKQKKKLEIKLKKLQ